MPIGITLITIIIKFELFIVTGCNWLPSQEGSQLQPVTKQIAQLFLYSNLILLTFPYYSDNTDLLDSVR